MDKEKLHLVSAIALNRAFGHEPRFSHQIIDALGSCEALFTMSRAELDDLFGPYTRYAGIVAQADLAAAEREYDALSSSGCQFVSIFDDAYPALLRECSDAPILLYVRSSTPVEELFNKRPAISIVGTRDISSYGRDWCTRIVKAISEAPIKPLIISGMAFGVDIAAHMAALAYGLPTIGVSPVGIERVYPARHSIAAERIVEAPGGALITDYPPGTDPLPVNFLRRNRIIAGISNATILVESRIKGGGMMTARLASGYGRDVFIVPGRIDDLRSQGCNSLMREKIAEPITSLEGLSDSLGLGHYSRRRKADLAAMVKERFSPDMEDATVAKLRTLVLAIKGHRDITLDELCEICHMDFPELSSLVSLLESEGFIVVDLLQQCSISGNL